MLIPSIDLMGGKIVQLVQGEKKALDFDDFEYWIERFSRYPLVQLIDLDAAIGSGNNRHLLERFISKLPCQVGGGIRDLETARQISEMGARRVIIGSALFKDGVIQKHLAEQFANTLTMEKLTFAVDAKQGKVAIHGWRTLTSFTAAEAMRELDRWCSTFLYTNIDTEGLLQGFPIDVIPELQNATKRKIIAAGGVSSMEEVEKLDAMGVDAIVGMAIYTGKIKT
ncbi:MAG TPA: 1-(5-phosphoribosyl)-5-[(5-phosphoribosylamino)methylideneamino] imidazole-4-carboxamide isomerase [Terriglobales bacterium]|nr:1-(5-phosphoribosyl)-5-[(5-phosphoribosylamino)methylideneamino] imidazole-4-carboxamide isomerase [Terriglobales bacterium]